jgi:hypothetical protein
MNFLGYNDRQNIPAHMLAEINQHCPRGITREYLEMVLQRLAQTELNLQRRERDLYNLYQEMRGMYRERDYGYSNSYTSTSSAPVSTEERTYNNQSRSHVASNKHNYYHGYKKERGEQYNRHWQSNTDNRSYRPHRNYTHRKNSPTRNANPYNLTSPRRSQPQMHSMPTPVSPVHLASSTLPVSPVAPPHKSYADAVKAPTQNVNSEYSSTPPSMPVLDYMDELEDYAYGGIEASSLQSKEPKEPKESPKPKKSEKIVKPANPTNVNSSTNEYDNIDIVN